MIKKLDWDSDFFGVGTGSIRLTDAAEAGWQEVRAGMQQLNLGLLYVFDAEESNDAHGDSFLASSGAKLMDRKVVFAKQLLQAPLRDSSIREYTMFPPEEAMYSLALQSGIYSRFRLDDRFPEGSFERMYRLWIEKSITGEMADKVLVAVHEEKIVGMITIKHSAEESSIGLVAVDKNMRGMQLGKKLMDAAGQEAFQRPGKRITVATQLDNEPACAFYRKQGYDVQSVTRIWHIFL
jgi:dTDP-4-amino-4,6-dideoxy-D-galactose acyltransferase